MNKTLDTPYELALFVIAYMCNHGTDVTMIDDCADDDNLVWPQFAADAQAAIKRMADAMAE